MQVSPITGTPTACEAHEFTLGVLRISGILTFPGEGGGKSQRVRSYQTPFFCIVGPISACMLANAIPNSLF